MTICVRNMSTDPAYSSCPECGHSGLLHPLVLSMEAERAGARPIETCQVCLVEAAAARVERILGQIDEVGWQ